MLEADQRKKEIEEELQQMYDPAINSPRRNELKRKLQVYEETLETMMKKLGDVSVDRISMIHPLLCAPICTIHIYLYDIPFGARMQQCCSLRTRTYTHTHTLSLSFSLSLTHMWHDVWRQLTDMRAHAQQRYSHR